MILAVVVALVWISYAKRKDGRSSNAQTVELENEDRAGSGGASQLDGDPVKPELSGVSPAVVPSLMSSRSCQQEATSSRDKGLETRCELPTGVD